MSKSATKVAEVSGVSRLTEQVFDFIVSYREFVAPFLVSMLSALYFFQYSSHQALFFSALGFMGLAFIIQLQRTGLWVAIALQGLFFAYIVHEEQGLSAEQTCFSIGIVLAYSIASLFFETETYMQESLEMQQLALRIETEQKRGAQFHKELEAVITRTTLLAQEREELLMAKKTLEATVLELQSQRDFVCEDSSIHPSEAKYRQLREQFEEKSHVLDEVRKELFLAQEQISVFQKRLQEPNEEVIALTKEVSLLESCTAAMEQLYKKEIVAYEQLVEMLSKQIANNE